jgi:hypothetical protein
MWIATLHDIFIPGRNNCKHPNVLDNHSYLNNVLLWISVFEIPLQEWCTQPALYFFIQRGPDRLQLHL